MHRDRFEKLLIRKFTSDPSLRGEPWEIIKGELTDLYTNIKEEFVSTPRSCVLPRYWMISWSWSLMTIAILFGLRLHVSIRTLAALEQACLDLYKGEITGL